MMFHRIKAFFNPEQFQGWGKKHSYFEGWYFKVVNSTENKAFAFIPGIAIDESGKRQAFIQVLDGKKQTAQYHKFEAESFIPEPGRFLISINNNHFSAESIRINLPDMKGELCFSGNIPWPKPWYSPGIMGPYAFVPFMECYHGIVSMDHVIEGQLQMNTEIIDFTNGRGYIEKDWGRSFPSAYIWLQSNHFSIPGVSVKASVAKIPWLRSSFVGFIAGIWLDHRLIQFTTYNRTVLRKSEIKYKKVILVMENKKYRLEILAQGHLPAALASPIKGAMEGRIEESMSSIVEVNLTDLKSRKSIFHDTGRNASVEFAGKIEEIIIQ